jgi:hypothetical protein
VKRGPAGGWLPVPIREWGKGEIKSMVITEL